MTIRRVLMTADAVGGVWTYALELARALGVKGIEVTLATMGPPPRPQQQEEALRIPNLRLHSSAYKLEWMEDPWEDVDRAGEWLLSLAEDVHADVAHLNGYVHASLPWSIPVLVVGHSCVLSWWQAVHGEPAPEMWRTYRERVTAGLQAAGSVVAPSRAMLDALTRHYRSLPCPAVIPNARCAHLFSPGPKQPLILTAGRLWDKAKNLSALDGIAPELEWPVYAAGSGGSAKHMQMLGELGPEELPAWFARTSIYVLPAKYEPFGLSVLEAALAGCALVLGDIPSLRENWDGAALFAPPEDPNAILSQLRVLVRSDAVRHSLQRAARVRALKFTPEKMAASYVACYGSLGTRNAAMTTGDNHGGGNQKMRQSCL